MRSSTPVRRTRWVTVRWRTDELELEIANDGDADAVPNGGGHGLLGMRERVSLYGGTIDGRPAAGRRVRGHGTSTPGGDSA